jgi:hypothetical protein
MGSARSNGRILGCLLLLVGVASARAAEPAKNRPPRITGSAPRDCFGLEPVEFRWGKELRLVVNAHDPDEDRLELRMEGAPAEATFDPVDRVFRWTPAQAQKGTHEIRFLVSDGTFTESRLMRIKVVDNHAPELPVEREVHLNSDHASQITIGGSDTDGDALTYQVDGLPRGARHEGPKSALVQWTPKEDQIGLHVLHVTVTDGELTAARDLELLVEDEWSTMFLPGIYYSLWSPRAHEALGTMQGVGMEVVPYAWIHRNANRGPSHGRITVRADLLHSNKDGVGLALLYAVGLDLSIERKPYRRWLIPFFGVDGGGVVTANDGHHFQSSPHLGIYLWTSRNVFVSVTGAYQIVPARLDTLGGWRASAGLNLTLW